MSRVFLSLGSNINPEKNIPAAIALLKKRFSVVKISSVYETTPVGPAGDKKFWNLAAEIQAEETRENLLPKLRELEAALGRTRSENKFAPRTIDIDILPQPDYQRQAFIMIPLAEIAPEDTDPESGKKFHLLAENMREEAKHFRKIISHQI